MPPHSSSAVYGPVGNHTRTVALLSLTIGANTTQSMCLIVAMQPLGQLPGTEEVEDVKKACIS